MSDIVRKLGRRVKALREARGLTQADVAERVGIAPNTLSRVERGTVGVSLEVLGRLAKALDVAPAAMLDFDSDAGRDAGDIAAAVDELPSDPAKLKRRLRAALVVLLGKKQA